MNNPILTSFEFRKIISDIGSYDMFFDFHDGNNTVSIGYYKSIFNQITASQHQMISESETPHILIPIYDVSRVPEIKEWLLGKSFCKTIYISQVTDYLDIPDDRIFTPMSDTCHVPRNVFLEREEFWDIELLVGNLDYNEDYIVADKEFIITHQLNLGPHIVPSFHEFENFIKHEVFDINLINFYSDMSKDSRVNKLCSFNKETLVYFEPDKISIQWTNNEMNMYFGRRIISPNSKFLITGQQCEDHLGYIINLTTGQRRPLFDHHTVGISDDGMTIIVHEMSEDGKNSYLVLKNTFSSNQKKIPIPIDYQDITQAYVNNKLDRVWYVITKTHEKYVSREENEYCKTRFVKQVVVSNKSHPRYSYIVHDLIGGQWKSGKCYRYFPNNSVFVLKGKNFEYYVEQNGDYFLHKSISEQRKDLKYSYKTGDVVMNYDNLVLIKEKTRNKKGKTSQSLILVDIITKKRINVNNMQGPVFLYGTLVYTNGKILCKGKPEYIANNIVLCDVQSGNLIVNAVHNGCYPAICGLPFDILTRNYLTMCGSDNDSFIKSYQSVN